MKKQRSLGLGLLGLSVATLIIPFATPPAEAYGKKVYSKYPLNGYVCTRPRGAILYTCYSTPVGNQGINFTFGNRRYSF